MPWTMDGAGNYYTGTIIFSSYTSSATTTNYTIITPPGGMALPAYSPYTYDWQPLGEMDPIGFRETPTPQPVNPEDAERDAERLQAEHARIYTARQQELDERARSRTEATERATALLLALLNTHQREQYEARHSFEVIGSHGTRYRINRGTSGNVEWLTPDGVVGGQMCAHPTMRGNWLPEPDVHIGQMLALQTDEVAFVQLANMYYGRRPELATA